MGIHHYKIELLPKAFFGQQIPGKLSNADVERGEDIASGWWASFPPSERLVSAMRTLLPKDKSWSETEEYVSEPSWGSDVRIWKEGGAVWKIIFRFSLVVDGWTLMERFIAVARDECCVLLEAGSLLILEPDEDIVRERLSASHAIRFVRDPEGTLVQFSKKFED